jgi:predicted RNase H-like nuclease (RuvC/YqgF family)
LIPHETTGAMIRVPGRVVSPEEQEMIAKLQWEITRCKEQSAGLRNEIKTTKERIEKNKSKLEELRGERDCLKDSGEYAIDLTLSNNGVGKCLIGPHIQKLLDRQVKDE